VGPLGASIGRCVATQPGSDSVVAAPSVPPPVERELRCNPSEDPHWRGATFEEKERLYDACLRGPVNYPL
jgi:hypothetical protein